LSNIAQAIVKALGDALLDHIKEKNTRNKSGHVWAAAMECATHLREEFPEALGLHMDAAVNELYLALFQKHHSRVYVFPNFKEWKCYTKGSKGFSKMKLDPTRRGPSELHAAYCKCGEK